MKELVGYIFWDLSIDKSKKVIRAYTNKGTLYLRAWVSCCSDCFINHVMLCGLIGEKIVNSRITGDRYGDFILVLNTQKGTSTFEMRNVDYNDDPGSAYVGDISIDNTTDYSRTKFELLSDF